MRNAITVAPSQVAPREQTPVPPPRGLLWVLSLLAAVSLRGFGEGSSAVATVVGRHREA